jgi:hypothetical protein
VHLVNDSQMPLEFFMQFSDHDRSQGGPAYDRRHSWQVPVGGRLTVFVRNSRMGSNVGAFWVGRPECSWSDGDGAGPDPDAVSTVTVLHGSPEPLHLCDGKPELTGRLTPWENWQ